MGRTIAARRDGVGADGRHAHLFVAVGDATLEGAGALAEGDAVRLSGAGSPKLTAGGSGAEVLIWVTA